MTFSDQCSFRAGAAQKQGLFDAEIVPVATQLIDKDGNETKVVVSFNMM